SDPNSFEKPDATLRWSDAGASPLPVSETDAEPPGVPAAVKVATFALPALAGLKVTEIVHVPFGASVVPQVVVVENSLAFAPPSVIAIGVAVEPAETSPLFVTVST